MKKIIKSLLFLMSMILSVASFAAVNSDDDAKKGEFKFEKETHDFGKIKKDIPATYEFLFTNTGDEPIIIWQAKASCGCTEPEYPSMPIKKGATAKIKVTYNAKAVGPFTKSVTLQSNAKTSTKVIYIKGEVVE